jgi:phage terminase large subunit
VLYYDLSAFNHTQIGVNDAKNNDAARERVFAESEGMGAGLHHHFGRLYQTSVYPMNIHLKGNFMVYARNR